ncbi:MAG: NAD(P)/FAD-dependent oxidoreductase [Gemmatimonadetes bacterium]|nr:NAD(P)/FAD-dependent oxidoreductase [Gemmatimonadota bacterium]
MTSNDDLGKRRTGLVRHDVVVVGAGPAGSATALTLSRAGVDVHLVDRAELPRWKVCGGCLGPAALELLGELGLMADLIGAGAVPIPVMELRAGSRRARLRLPGSLSISRYRLDALLAGAVAKAGGEVSFGVRVEGVTPVDDGMEVRIREDGVVGRLHARVVVDATGLGGLHLPGERSTEEVASGSRVGLGAVFPSAAYHMCPSGELQMTVGRDGYVGIVRTEDGLLDVAAAVDRDLLARMGPGGAVSELLASTGGPRSGGNRLPDGEPSFGWRGTPALTRRSIRTAEGAVFRVGDAAGYVEPFTGEGMGWALAGGVALAPFVRQAVAGPSDRAAAGWTQAYRRIVERRQRMCRLLAHGLRRPAVVRAVVGALGVAPVLARPLMDATGRDSRVPLPTLAAP